MRKAVVTGIGLVTSAGIGKGALWDALEHNRSGLSEITLFDTKKYRAHSGGEVKNILVKGNNRAKTFLEYALIEAMKDADISSPFDCSDLFIGTAHGSLDIWEQYYSNQFNCDFGKEFPLWRLPKGLLEGNINARVISTACTSSTIAAGLALWRIRTGAADIAFVGGVDILNNFIFAGFDSLRALTPSLCRPFDRNRDGLVLGEGAGVLIVEELEHAIKRGAKIYGEITGFSVISDAKNITAPDSAGRGASTAIRNAIKESNLDNKDINYINLHGTGTVHNDKMECMAIRSVFKECASEIPMSSIKPITGHTSGAAGVIEIAVCLLSMKYGLIPSTLNHLEPEIEFKDFDFVANKPKQKDIKIALSINSAFGGSNAAIIMRKI